MVIEIILERKGKNMKRLVKGHDRKICGVCGGIAEYFNVSYLSFQVLSI